MLEVRIRAKAFDGRPVLHDVRFAGRAGEVLVLMGPSGIGKSTLLNIVLGIDRAFEGEVRLAPGRLGVMFQEPRLLSWFSVAENLRLVRPGLSGREIAGLLSEATLDDVAALWPAQLSLGMARRVALARALAVEPEVLVLDEPFASLDRNLADALAGRVAARTRANAMLTLVSVHELDRALAIADRILVLAGNPATLAADVAVARGGTGLRDDLIAQFPFLGAHKD